MEKRLMAVLLPALIANRGLRYFQCHANVRSTTHRCRPNFSLLSLSALSCYTALYPAPSQGSFALSVVVSFVGVKFLGVLPRPAVRTLDGLCGVDEFFEDHRVVDVGGGEGPRERDPFSVRNKVALRALLSLIRRIRSGFPPFWRGCYPNPQRRASSLSARPLGGDRAR